MIASRKLAVPLALVLSLLLGIPVTAEASGSTTTHRRVITPASFTMSPTICPLIHSTVVGAGTSVGDVTVIRYADGRLKLIERTIIPGAAVDGHGRHYRFLYTNHMVATAPAGGSPVRVLMHDTFRLTGRGPGADHVDLGLLWRWSYAPTTDDLPTTVAPGLWPPGPDLVKIWTRGLVEITPTGLTCDPL